MPSITSTDRFLKLVTREQEYLLQTYARYPVAFERGEGVYLYDLEGKRYLDFVAGLGVNALGHAHPRMVQVIREQCAKLVHTSNLYYNEYQGVLAEKLCGLSGMSKAFFGNSGTEVMEGALKLARAFGRQIGSEAKCSIVALQGSYHGRSFGAMSVTGQSKYQKGFEPLLPGVQFVELNDLAGLHSLVDQNTCAIVLEPIQGEGGIRECSEEFLQVARELADEHRAVLIFDEIQCGLGRTGDYFAFQTFGVAPDVVCVAKPIAGGLPLGAFLVRQELASAITTGKHGTTFGGGPLACRTALEYLAILHDEELLKHVRSTGDYMQEQFKNLAKKHGCIREVRGRGFIQGILLDCPARPVVEAALQRGILFNSTQDFVLRFLPPYLLKHGHVDEGIALLDELLSLS